MKAITLHQPWASLIAEGVKAVETRPKQHPWRSAIGETIAIHASVKQIPALGGQSWGAYSVRPVGNYGRCLLGPGLPEFRSTPRLEGYMLPFGAVVATCTLVDVVPMVDDDDDLTEDPAIKSVLALNEKQLSRDDPELWERCRIHVAGRDDFDGWQRTKTLYDQRPFGDFAPGRFALLLDDVVKLTEPVHEVGGFHRGCWTVPDVDERRIREQVAA